MTINFDDSGGLSAEKALAPKKIKIKRIKENLHLFFNIIRVNFGGVSSLFKVDILLRPMEMSSKN